MRRLCLYVRVVGLIEQPVRLVRLTRAEPPGYAAGDDARRAIYGAALQQFEELLAAAGAVGPMSRPLPLFYALSQAGRAIVAAFGEKPEIGSHGLSEVRSAGVTDVRRFQIRATQGSRSAFAAVAAATSSEAFIGSVELGALWAALSERAYMPSEGWDSAWRPSLGLLVTGTPCENGAMPAFLAAALARPLEIGHCRREQYVPHLACER